MKHVTIIHAVENKYEHKFERQLKTYLTSFQKNSPLLFSTIDLLFIQPTDNDIDNETVTFIESFGAKFEKNLAKLGQHNEDQNFTNNVNSINAAIEKISTDYICWLDTDVVFLSDDENFFKDTDAIVSSIYPIQKNNDTSHISYSNAEEIETLTDLDFFYQTYFKPHMPVKYQIENLDYYVNTWITYGSKSSNFWKDWQTLTLLMIDIVQEHYPTQVELGLESICEELAASILYCGDFYKFINVHDFFGSNKTSMLWTSDVRSSLTADCLLLHYTGVYDILATGLTGDYEHDIFSMLNKVLSSGDMSNSDYIKLAKKL